MALDGEPEIVTVAEAVKSTPVYDPVVKSVPAGAGDQETSKDVATHVPSRIRFRTLLGDHLPTVVIALATLG